MRSARIDHKDLADSTVVKESIILLEKVPEALVSEALKKTRLDEFSPSEVYKDVSPDADSDKPTIQAGKTEVVPSSILTPAMERAVVDD